VEGHRKNKTKKNYETNNFYQNKHLSNTSFKSNKSSWGGGGDVVEPGDFSDVVDL
jgi:hypothetical protein